MEKLVTEGDHPTWLTHGRTVLRLKDPSQSLILSKYCPITCLSTTWKLQSGTLANKIRVHMDEYMYQVQRSIGGGGRELNHQLLIDRLVDRDSWNKCTNLAIVWSDYKNAYDSVPHFWLLKYLSLYKICSSDFHYAINHTLKNNFIR